MNNRHAMFRALTFQQPLLYLVVYVTVIPLYAAIYHFMDHQFFQATSQFDTTFLVARERCENVLRDIYAVWLAELVGKRHPISNNDVWITNMRISDDDLQCRVSWTLQVPDGRGLRNGQPVEFGSSEWTIELPLPEHDGMLNPNGLEFEATGVPDHLVKLLPPKVAPERTAWGQHFYGGILGRSKAGNGAVLSGEVWLEQPIQDELTIFRQPLRV